MMRRRRKEITVDFFENIIKLSIYDTFVSEYVLAEIKRTPNVIRRNQLMKVFEDYPIAVLPNPSVTEVEVLSVAYLD